MKRFLALIMAALLLAGGIPSALCEAIPTPFEKHGAIHVEGTQLTDAHGNAFHLYGMSTHGIAWFPQYVSLESFRTLRDVWNTNCVRIAMYTYENGGYCVGGDRERLKQLVRDAADYALQLGMYVIVDWHVLNECSPNVYVEDAVAFFDEMSNAFAGRGNVLYEICNEPNRTSDWNDIRAYAQTVIPVIRENDPESVIIVGTPSWSQDIHEALADPLPYDNLLYAVHFYAASHFMWLRRRVTSCLDKGLPIIVSEFNICDASGGGEPNYREGEAWMEAIRSYGLSYLCWNLSNSGETCSLISADCKKLDGWTRDDLTETGKWIFDCFAVEER